MSLFGQPAPKSSLFDSLSTSQSTTQPSQSASTSSVFGNLQSQQQQQSQSSLFPSLASSQHQTSQPSLFSTLSSSELQQSQPAQPSLFAGLGNSQAQQSQATSASLFPNFGGSQPHQSNSLSESLKPAGSQPASVSLFAPQAASASSGASLFGYQPPQPPKQANQAGQQPSTSGKVAQPAYFDSLLEKGKKRIRDTNGSSTFGELPGLQLGLHDIARRVRELGAAGAQVTGNKAPDSKAHYLLAASGVNPGTTRRDLDSLDLQPTAARDIQVPSDFDPDTDRYVDQLQQQSTLKMIAEGVERAQKNFDAYLDENIDINWEAQRKKIYEHFGLLSKSDERVGGRSYLTSPTAKGSFGRSTRRSRNTLGDKSGRSMLNRSVFGPSSLQKSVIGSPSVGSRTESLFADVEAASGSTIGTGDRFSREKQGRFAEVVQSLNQSRLQEKSFPLLNEFKNVQAQPGGDSPHQLIDAYKALIEIVQEKSASGPSELLGRNNAFQERRLAVQYLDEVPNSANQVNMRKVILDGSRRSLEKQFLDSVENLISRNPKEASIGGMPTPVNKIRAYIRVRDAQRNLIDDGLELQKIGDNEPLWAIVYYLLRCGLAKDAAEYVQENATAFRAIERNFPSYITSYVKSPEKRLSREYQDRITKEYQHKSRIAPENALDPYKMACYKVIGRCELSKRTIEGWNQYSNDWIWLQFCLAREVNRLEEAAGDVFGLEEIRDTVREVGQRHFQKGQEGVGGYGTYFYLLILSGLFEQGISYLYSYTYISAVHFAIALDYYGLLRVSDLSVSESELRKSICSSSFRTKRAQARLTLHIVTYSTKELPQISFGRMLGYYTRDFRASKLDAAVDYLTLICLNADLQGALGKSQASLCHEALRELLLESREFARLLGDIRRDGTRLKGSIEQRLKLIGLANQESFLKEITIQAASVADDNGRTNDAVLLYHLAEDYENVITIVNRALSEAIAVELGEPEPKLQPLKPRSNTADLTSSQQEQGGEFQPNTSFSLTSVDNPTDLARNMLTLYSSTPLTFQAVNPDTRQTCSLLLRLSAAKSHLLAQNSSLALETLASTNLLPLTARGSIPAIRAHAANSNSLPQPIARNLGNVLRWAIRAIGEERELRECH